MNLSVISSIKNRDQISITMVCLGNICRSPMAAAVLANKKKAIQSPVITVDSAGTGPWHIGQGPHPSSKKIWEKAGRSFDPALKGIDPTSADYFKLEVPDPYNQSDEAYEATLAMVERAVDGLLAELNS